MGAVARAAMAAGGETFGVIPAHLRRPRGRPPRSRRLVVTETMHERKKVMFMNADAIVTLPGGPGTLDELFEVLTWRQLGLHAKPVFLLNVGGYWDPLLALLDHIVARGLRRAELPRLPRASGQRAEARLPASRRPLLTPGLARESASPDQISVKAMACHQVNGSPKSATATMNCSVGFRYCTSPSVA